MNIFFMDGEGEGDQRKNVLPIISHFITTGPKICFMFIKRQYS